MKDRATHKTVTILSKYSEYFLPGETAREFQIRCRPYSRFVLYGNALVEAGVDLLWNLVCGGGGTDYGSGNGNIDVYIVDHWDTGTLEGGYPTFGSGGTATWKAYWSGTDGDGLWSKWAVTNGSQHLNEKDETLGTKDGGTWFLEVSITIT